MSSNHEREAGWRCGGGYLCTCAGHPHAGEVARPEVALPHVCDESRSTGRCTCDDRTLPCGHPLSSEIEDACTHPPDVRCDCSQRDDGVPFCGDCALAELADEVRGAIEYEDEMWAGTMAARAVSIARVLGRYEDEEGAR
jgi:hypothetical protein